MSENSFLKVIYVKGDKEDFSLNFAYAQFDSAYYRLYQTVGSFVRTCIAYCEYLKYLHKLCCKIFDSILVAQL